MDEVAREWRRLARHEAAHAVVARVLGLTVNRVYLHPGGGNTDTEGGGFGDDFRAREAVMAAAGAASDRAQGYDRYGSAGDRAEIAKLTAQMREPFDVEGWADELVVEHQREIDLVLEALLQTGELSGEQVDRYMAIARGDSAG